MRKINIYAPTYKQASDLAAKMNLALRHWEYAAAWQAGPETWADVGSVMDEYQQALHCRAGECPPNCTGA